MNVQHILVPTDLSPLSLRPLERAAELFDGKHVTLLHVVDNVHHMEPASPFVPSREDPSLQPRMDSARAALEKVKAAVPQARQVAIEVLAAADTGRAAAEWAAKNGIDLIAMSTHGRTGVRRFFLGSVAERLLRYSTIPVLTFPDRDDED